MTAAVEEIQARMATIQARFTMARPPAATTGAEARPAARTAATAFGEALARAQEPFTASAAAAVAPSPSVAAGGEPDGAGVIAAARRYLGVPYRWGGTDPATGLDCSGFLQRAFADVGVRLPRVSADQARAGRPVASLAEARPGDLLAFDWNGERSGIDHIGIYMGGGKMIVAPRTGDVVKVQDVTRPPAAIRRVLAGGGGAAAMAPAPAMARPATAPATAGPGGAPAGLDDLFAAAGARHGVSPALLSAVARAESSFDTDAVSPAGALGLMQLMPATARGLGVDPLDPAQAVDGAARLLAGHLRRFGSVPLALAAYNAGGGAVARHGGIPPYAETQAYVARITAQLEETS